MKHPSYEDQHRWDEVSLPSGVSALLWTVLCSLSRTASPSYPAGTACREGWNVLSRRTCWTSAAQGKDPSVRHSGIHRCTAGRISNRHELAVQSLSVGVPVKPQELVMEHRNDVHLVRSPAAHADVVIILAIYLIKRLSFPSSDGCSPLYHRLPQIEWNNGPYEPHPSLPHYPFSLEKLSDSCGLHILPLYPI